MAIPSDVSKIEKHYIFMKHIIESREGILCRMDHSWNYLEARPSPFIDIYYGRKEHLSKYAPSLQKVLSAEENSRLQKLRREDDKIMYILSHSLLRLLMGCRLRSDPGSITFLKDKNGRPFIPGEKLYFNISHTRNAFAVAIAKTYVPGIDIERINRDIDHEQVAENYFSNKEIEYISRDRQERKAFYRLWTRKESLLKSIGSGIVTDLTKVEVSGDSNSLPSELFPDEKFSPLYEKYYIYSLDIDDHYLSITIPEKRDLEIKQFTGSFINELIDTVVKEPVKQ